MLIKWFENMALRGGKESVVIQPVTFCIYLVREILFLSVKSQGILTEK